MRIRDENTIQEQMLNEEICLIGKGGRKERGNLASTTAHETCDGDTCYGSCTTDECHANVTLW